MKNCVYRFLNEENKIIYIGKAVNLKSRIANHNHLPKQCYDETVKIEFIEFESADEMDFAERYFIPKCKPKYNTAMSNKVMNISLNEFDSKEWVSIEDYKKEQKKLTAYKERVEVIKSEIQSYIRHLEARHDIKIDIDINRYNINAETYRGFYNYIDEVVNYKILRKNHHNYNNRKVMCKGSGDVFDNLIEYKKYMEMNIPLEILLKAALDEDKIFLDTYHPKYNGVFTRPIFMDVFKTYSIEHQNRIQRAILEDTRSIICLTDKQIFSNKHHVTNETGIHYSRIVNCCNDLSTYAGTSNNGPLVWKWHDEYLNMTEEEVGQYIDKAEQNYYKKNKRKSN